MEGLTGLIWASLAFVGSHFVLSHPLRAPLVRLLGNNGFLILYSLVAIATFGWMAVEWRALPAGPSYWPGSGDLVWIAASLLMLLASILFVGSLFENPALPAPGVGRLAVKEPKGVFRITRHPMMWSFAIWGLVHILIAPRPENMVLAGAVIVLALVGARLQDIKKTGIWGEAWRSWRKQTSFVPFARGSANPGALALFGGIALWLGATWAHSYFNVPAAGIWRWF